MSTVNEDLVERGKFSFGAKLNTKIQKAYFCQ